MREARARPLWSRFENIGARDWAYSVSMAAIEPQLLLKSAELPELLPDPTNRRKVTWGQMCTRVARVDQLPFVDRDMVISLLSLRNKKNFEALSLSIWPPRTKEDLGLRRTRLLDYVQHMRRTRQEAALVEVLSSTRQGWDIIFVQNILAAVCIFGLEWYGRIKSIGAFDANLDHYVKTSKTLSDTIKVQGLDDANWVNYVEAHCLTGYRTLPFEGYNTEEEARKLASESGGEHNLFGREWDSLVKKYLPLERRRVDYISFTEFVTSGVWATAGSSSVGEVLVSFEGSEVSVKAAKNMVPYVYDLHQLAKECLTTTGQKNKTVDKCELGKVRLAVAGDIHTYLLMTWVNSLLGGAYDGWPGSTTDEGFEEQTKRLSRMLTLCGQMFGLPYDYKGFDHQPTTSELVSIVRHLCQHARGNVPESGLAEFNHVVNLILLGFENATLSGGGPEHHFSFKVEGGLMSGLRWTSVLGNAWNSVITGLVLELMTDWGMNIDSVERFIRGDDSAIFAPTYALGAAIEYGYKLVGAEAGEGKFSLQRHQVEFLRVWFSNRCYGYPLRAIPGLSQRKPWSNSPWSGQMVLSALSEVCRTLRRRVPLYEEAVSSLWGTLRWVWCSYHSIPVAACGVAEHSGGLGIELDLSSSLARVEPPIPTFPAASGQVRTQVTDWRRDRLTEYFLKRYSEHIPRERADAVVQEECLGMLSTDSIPQVARRLREAWASEIRATVYRIVRVRVPLVHVSRPFPFDAYPHDSVTKLLGDLKRRCPLFGSCPDVVRCREDWNKLRPPGSFTDWMKAHFPGI